MDLSTLSDEELDALEREDYSALSSSTLDYLETEGQRSAADDPVRDANAAAVDAELASAKALKENPRNAWGKVLFDAVPTAVRGTINAVLQTPQNAVNLGGALGGMAASAVGAVEPSELPGPIFPPESMPSVESIARWAGAGRKGSWVEGDPDGDPTDFLLGVDPGMQNLTDDEKVASTAAQAGILGMVNPAQTARTVVSTGLKAATSGALAQGLTNEGHPWAGLLAGAVAPGVASMGAMPARWAGNKVVDYIAKAAPSAQWAASRNSARMFNDAWDSMTPDAQKRVMEALERGGAELVPGARPNVGQTIAGAQGPTDKFGTIMMRLQKQLENTDASRSAMGEQTQAIKNTLLELAGGDSPTQARTLANLEAEQGAVMDGLFNNIAGRTNVADRELIPLEGLLGTRSRNAEIQVPFLDEAATAAEARRVNALKQSGQMQAESTAALNSATKVPEFPSRGLLEAVAIGDQARTLPRGLLTVERGTDVSPPITGQYPAQQRTTVPGPLPGERPNIETHTNLPNVMPRRNSPLSDTDLARSRITAEAADEFAAAANAARDEAAALRAQKGKLLDEKAEAETLLNNKLADLASKNIKPLTGQSILSQVGKARKDARNLPDDFVNVVLDHLDGMVRKSINPETGRIDSRSLLEARALSNQKIDELMAANPKWLDKKATGEVLKFKGAIDEALVSAGGAGTREALTNAFGKYGQYQNMKDSMRVRGALREALESSKSTDDNLVLDPTRRFLDATAFDKQSSADFLQRNGVNSKFRSMSDLLSKEEMDQVMALRQHLLRNEEMTTGSKGGLLSQVPNPALPMVGPTSAALDRTLRNNRTRAQARAEEELAKTMRDPQKALGLLSGRGSKNPYNRGLLLPLAVLGPQMLEDDVTIPYRR